MARTTTDFRKARVGTSAVQVCCTCGSTMGVLIKTQAGKNSPEYVGPSEIAVEDQKCEFCDFLGLWLAHEGIVPSETGLKYGASKIVENDGGELIAFVPFSSDEDLTRELADGTKFTFQHAMVLGADHDGEAWKITKVLQGGV